MFMKILFKRNAKHNVLDAQGWEKHVGEAVNVNINRKHYIKW